MKMRIIAANDGLKRTIIKHKVEIFETAWEYFGRDVSLQFNTLDSCTLFLFRKFISNKLQFSRIFEMTQFPLLENNLTCD